MLTIVNNRNLISALLLIAILMVAGGYYWQSQPKDISTIVLATGQKGGLYHQFGKLLKEKLEKTGEHKVILDLSTGSVENIQSIRNKKAHFALVQSGIDSLNNIDVVAPLFVEPIYVLAKPNLNANRIEDLSAKIVGLGPKQSGSRISGNRILEHYQVTPSAIDSSYLNQLSLDSVDAVIAVGGLLNDDLRSLVTEQQLQLLPIDDNQALQLKYPHLVPFEIPKSVFTVSVPPRPVPSVAVTAMLICNTDVPSSTVKSVLKAIYNTNLRTQFPLMMTPNEVKQWGLFPIKPAALEFLDPYSGIGVFADFAESLAAIKELIFALCAISYFSWLGMKKRRHAKNQLELNRYKEQLDSFLDETVKVEWKLNYAKTQEELYDLLDQACEIKLQALTELTHEKLRGDNLFAIFLVQCSNLILRIENKIRIKDTVSPETP